MFWERKLIYFVTGNCQQNTVFRLKLPCEVFGAALWGGLCTLRSRLASSWCPFPPRTFGPALPNSVWLMFFRASPFRAVLFFRPHHVACGILVPQPGIKPTPPALEMQSLNHWTNREVPWGCSFFFFPWVFIPLV